MHGLGNSFGAAPPIALEQGKRAAADVMRAVPELAKHGGAREKQEQGSDATLKKGRGSSYLAGRIKRDAPEIAAAVERGAEKWGG